MGAQLGDILYAERLGIPGKISVQDIIDLAGENSQTPYITFVQSTNADAVNQTIQVLGRDFSPKTVFTITGTGNSVQSVEYIDPTSVRLTINTGISGNYKLIAENPGNNISTSWQNTNNDTLTLVAPTGTGPAGISISNFEDGTLGDWANFGDNNWQVDAGGTPSGSTGPTSAQEGTNYLYTEVSAPVVEGSNFIILSSNFRSATEIRYFIHLFSLQSQPVLGTLFLEYTADNSNTWNILRTYDSPIQAAQADPFQLEVLDLTGLGVNALRFRVVKGTGGNSWQSDFALDDIRITSVEP